MCCCQIFHSPEKIWIDNINPAPRVWSDGPSPFSLVGKLELLRGCPTKSLKLAHFFRPKRHSHWTEMVDDLITTRCCNCCDIFTRIKHEMRRNLIRISAEEKLFSIGES
jgi:hypothetical protein